MRSLIILEVEHNDTIDDLDAFADYMCSRLPEWGLKYQNSTFHVDLPECFKLE